MTMLAPDIVEAIFEGRQPRQLNLHTLRGREDLTAVLQVAFPQVGPTTIRVRYGAPLDAAALAADDPDADAITARIKNVVRGQLLETMVRHAR